MRAGHATEARDLYRASNPELFAGADPRVGSANLGAAIRVAAAELKLGERQHAEMLLGKCAAYIGSRDDGTRRATYRLERVQIHALMGGQDEALTAMRQAIDDGFRPGSKPFQIDPTVDSIRDDPRFIAMTKEIGSDIDRMRRALAASGKSHLPPDLAHAHGNSGIESRNEQQADCADHDPIRSRGREYRLESRAASRRRKEPRAKGEAEHHEDRVQYVHDKHDQEEPAHVSRGAAFGARLLECDDLAHRPGRSWLRGWQD